MAKVIKKLFGGIDLTWPKLILWAVAAGIFTAAMAMIPAVQNTSFHAIAVSFEVWIMFGILIIMNSKSNLDSALKCFVFFLISQPLVYLIQVPFSQLGWQLFGYYRYWFIWTLLCFPMGYIGYYMKKGKWWGYLILLPMLGLTAYSYVAYFADCQFSAPRYLLITLFCACALLLYPVAIFEDKTIKTFGAALSAVAVIALAVYCLLNPPVYRTIIMGNTEEHPFDDTYTAYLADAKYGDVEIRYMESVEDYMLHAELKRSGNTLLTLVSPAGEKTEYDLHIERSTLEATKRSSGEAGTSPPDSTKAAQVIAPRSAEDDLLLLVDFQTVYLPGYDWACPSMPEALQNTVRILDASGAPDCVMTRFIAPASPVGRWQQYNEAYREINENPVLAELAEVLAPYAEKTTVVDKSTYSSMDAPEVRAAMEGKKAVVLAGVTAECCVLATMMDAMDLGYEVVYLYDCIAGQNAELEAQVRGIAEMYVPTQITVMSSAEYLAAIGKT